MLKPLVDYILDLLNIARDTRANKEEIAALRGEVDELASAVEKSPTKSAASARKNVTNAKNFCSDSKTRS